MIYAARLRIVEWFAIWPRRLTNGRWVWMHRVRERQHYRTEYWTSFGMPSDLYGQQESCSRWVRVSLEAA